MKEEGIIHEEAAEVGVKKASLWRTFNELRLFVVDGDALREGVLLRIARIRPFLRVAKIQAGNAVFTTVMMSHWLVSPEGACLKEFESLMLVRKDASAGKVLSEVNPSNMSVFRAGHIAAFLEEGS